MMFLRLPETAGAEMLQLKLGSALGPPLRLHTEAERDTGNWQRRMLLLLLPKDEGTVHLGADILHLVAASGWLGALVPLAVLLNAACAKADEFSIAIARIATQRFSSLGIASVGTLVATGIVNSWVLVGSLDALIVTGYGRVLSLKLLLFFAMVSIAAVNRLRLTPRLFKERGDIRNVALRQLRNNSLIEATLGLIVLYLVGILGTLPPGSHE